MIIDAFDVSLIDGDAVFQHFSPVPRARLSFRQQLFAYDIFA